MRCTHDAVYADFTAVVPFLAVGAHVLFHDTYHQGIHAAIVEVMDRFPGFTDCGFLTRNPHVIPPVLYQGMRLARYSEPVVDGHRYIREACRRAGAPEPGFDPYYNNWDDWANTVGLGVKGPAPDSSTEQSETASTGSNE